MILWQASKRIFLCSFILCVFVASVQADLVGLWRFDEGSGSDAADSSTYGNDAGLWAGPDGLSGGAVSSSTEPIWITRGSGYALEFGTPSEGVAPDSDNTNWNYVYVKDAYRASLANLGVKWTIAFWYNQYVDDASINIGGAGYQRVISCPSYEYELGISSWKYDYFWPHYLPDATETPFCVELGESASLNTWHHIAIVYDGVNLKKYVDGVLDSAATKNIPGESLPSTWDGGEYLQFGAQSGADKDFFIGALDDVAIFNQDLSASEVSTIMGGDFSGPWVETAIEDDKPITYVWDPSFIAQYYGGVSLDFGEKESGRVSWNWQVEGLANNDNYYGVANAGLWDGDPQNVEYAGYCTVEDMITQVCVWKDIHEDTVYDLSARFGGENAIGNVVGVKVYAVDVNEPDNQSLWVLIEDFSQTIAANETWYEFSSSFTADSQHHAKRFKVVGYIDQGSGNGRGDAFAWFDEVRIDANDFLTCAALVAYNYGSALEGDISDDCKVNFVDYTFIANDWLESDPEPAVVDGDMLVNGDLYADIYRVPNNLDYDGGAPTGWEFNPATTDTDKAGIWNLDRDGLVDLDDYQPAGGSVTVFIDEDIDLEQIVSTPIEQGQTYYVSAMLGGTGGAYLNMASMYLEYVDSPTNPTTSTVVADANYILPENLVWRRFDLEYTADSAAAGKYLRLRFDYSGNPVTLPPDPNGYAAIGSASITTSQPAVWGRENLLVNGDFEDYSSLPMGTNDNDGWLDLFSYVNHYTYSSIPDWDVEDGLYGPYGYGLQCMLWAPAPQPAQGRVSCWFEDTISQKVTSETIQSGQTYYVDFVACLNASGYPSGQLEWPADEPNMVVDVYWLAPGKNSPTGTEGSDWGLIVSLQENVEWPLQGLNYAAGDWQIGETNFTATPVMSGKNFYVEAYCDNFDTPYATFEEIYLSKDPKPEIGPYTCYEKTYEYGLSNPNDLDGDCIIGLGDIAVIADRWLENVDPESN